MPLRFHEDYDYSGLMKPISRPISGQEGEWISTILQSNKDWADVAIGDLSVDGECACGCRTVHLRHTSEPQNPKHKDQAREHVGEIWIDTDSGKTIAVGLYARSGTLCELEVVYEQGTEPMPSSWREVSRKIWE
jgi:hypothetical protein